MSEIGRDLAPQSKLERDAESGRPAQPAGWAGPSATRGSSWSNAEELAGTSRISQSPPPYKPAHRPVTPKGRPGPSSQRVRRSVLRSSFPERSPQSIKQHGWLPGPIRPTPTLRRGAVSPLAWTPWPDKSEPGADGKGTASQSWGESGGDWDAPYGSWDENGNWCAPDEHPGDDTSGQQSNGYRDFPLFLAPPLMQDREEASGDRDALYAPGGEDDGGPWDAPYGNWDANGEWRAPDEHVSDRATVTEYKSAQNAGQESGQKRGPARRGRFPATLDEGFAVYSV